MPGKRLNLKVYGGPAAYYRQLKEEIEERWGYEPDDHDVISLLLENWPGCDEADLGEPRRKNGVRVD